MEEKLEAEPDFQYIPEKSAVDVSQQDGDSWLRARQQLCDDLSSGTLLAQFDVSGTIVVAAISITVTLH